MANLSNDNLQLGDAGRRVRLVAAIVGIAGVLLSLAMYRSVAPDRFFRAYLVAFWVVLAISLGGLIFTMILFATRAGWGTVVRRVFEVLAGHLRWLWVLFIPVALAMLFSGKTHLFEWNLPEVVADDSVLQGKEGYLNAKFWLVRAAIFWGIWAFLARYFLRNSVAQDQNGNLEYTYRMQRIAPVGILLFALTITLASIDWAMSLSPHWFSTIFGVYFFAASSAAFFSVVILTVYFLQRAGKLQGVVTLEHYQDLGKFLFAFGIVFWAYIAYSQFMLIWYGNLPEETVWYLVRSLGGWYGVSLLLLFGHFVIPFLVLVSRHSKRTKPVLAAAAAWMLFMAFVDFYWLIIPQIPGDLLAKMQTDLTMNYEQLVSIYQTSFIPAESLQHLGMDTSEQVTYEQVYGFVPHFVDLTWLVGLLGLYTAATVHVLGSAALIPMQDPRLSESLAFENV